jgi:hypothetical protein
LISSNNFLFRKKFQSTQKNTIQQSTNGGKKGSGKRSKKRKRKSAKQTAEEIPKQTGNAIEMIRLQGYRNLQ